MKDNLLKQMLVGSKDEFIKSVLALVLLAVARIIASNLPMIDNIDSPIYFEITEIISAFILIVMAVIIFNFGRNLKKELSNKYSTDIHVKIIFYITSALGTLILYYGLEEILPYYLVEIGLEWGENLYEYVFLILFLVIISMILYTLYKDFKELSLLFKSPTHSKSNPLNKELEKNYDQITCKNCEENLSTDAEFCINCGEKVEKQERINIKNCQSCNQELSADAVFCFNCGNKV